MDCCFTFFHSLKLYSLEHFKFTTYWGLNVQTNLLYHCVMFMCVRCHATRVTWPITTTIKPGKVHKLVRVNH